MSDVDYLEIFDVAEDLLTCAAEGILDTANPGLARAYVSMGEPAHDDCCVGQLVVWWQRIFPSATFPDADLNPVAVCAGPFTAIEFNVEVIRCAPTADANGNPPSPAALHESARMTNVDARAVWESVSCCLYRRRKEWSSVITEQVPVDPSGGCVGSRLTVTIGIVDGCHCPDV